AEAQLEHLLRPGREGDVAGRGLVALADDVAHLLAHGIEGDPEGLERLGADPLVLVDQAEQDVLGADVVVVQQPRLVLRQDDDATGAIGEAFEHGPPPSGGCDASRLRGSADGAPAVRRWRDGCSPRAWAPAAPGLRIGSSGPAIDGPPGAPAESGYAERTTARGRARRRRPPPGRVTRSEWRDMADLDVTRADAVLIGGGVASATLAAMLTELEPDW